jgi:hypothetical protein
VARVACTGGRAGTAVYGDLDLLPGLEAAVPVTCPGGRRPYDDLLVYTGPAAAPRLLGDALPATERGHLQSADFRDHSLVVGFLTRTEASSSTAAAETAVTTRWVREGDRLRRTDRWEDPASVFGAD